MLLVAAAHLEAEHAPGVPIEQEVDNGAHHDVLDEHRARENRARS